MLSDRLTFFFKASDSLSALYTLSHSEPPLVIVFLQSWLSGRRHVEAMLQELKQTVLKMSHHEQFSVEFMQDNLYFLGRPQSKGVYDKDDSDEWDLDTPWLDERWKLFYNGRFRLYMGDELFLVRNVVFPALRSTGHTRLIHCIRLKGSLYILW